MSRAKESTAVIRARGRTRRVAAVAFALACLGAEAAASCLMDVAPACQLFWHADVVFVGAVAEVTHTKKYKQAGDAEQWDRRDRVSRFHVEEAFRGEAGQGVSITTTEILETPVRYPNGTTGWKHTSSGDCGFKFEPGERYVVYAKFDNERPGVLRVALGRARPLAAAAEDLAFLRGVRTAAPKGRVFGAVRQHHPDLKGEGHVGPTPVEGVRVEVLGGGGAVAGAATTNREGLYEVTGLAPGEYEVRAELPEGLAAYPPQRARVAARGCARVDFETSLDGRVAGRVTDAEGRPLKELRVDLVHADGPPGSPRGMFVHTDAEGRYELREVPPGRYLLGFGLRSEPDARHPYPRTYYPGVARVPEAIAFDLAPGQRLTLFDLRLPPRLIERAVEVEVVWPDGRPAGGAILLLENDAYYPWRSSAPRWEGNGGEGRYRAHGFEGLTYWVHAYVNQQGGEQMHAEPIKFVLAEGAGPFRLVIASPGGTCTHYRSQ